MQIDNISSNTSTTEKGTVIASTTIRSGKQANQPNEETKSNIQSNDTWQAAPRAKAVKTAKNEITEPQKRPIPSFITDIMTRYSAELGDSTRSTRSNITRAAKMYYFACDFIKDAQEDPHRFFIDLLYEAKQAAYKVNCIQHRNTNNNPNRIPVFFTCLENRFELTPDERAYIRSDAPLVIR
jgi:hypothetical protein